MPEQFLNSIYVPQVYGADPETGKKRVLSEDGVIRIIKDTTTGKTRMEFEKAPTIPFWVSTVGKGYPELYVEKKHAREVVVKYSDRKKELAKELGKLQDFYNAASNGTMYQFNKEVLRSDKLYLADANIEDYQKTLFTHRFGRHFGKLNLSFMDIEVDISNHDGFPNADRAPCKINLINFMYVPTKSFFSIILRDPTNPGIAEVENDLEGFVKFLSDEIPESEKIQYNFIFVDDEASVIREFFRLIHRLEPDFCAIWTINFDIKTILNRMHFLGMDILNTICHPSVPLELQRVHYEEEKNEAGSDGGHPSRLWHWFTTSGPTQFIDQMSLYSNLRKRSILPSYKLDDVGNSEVNIRKVGLEDHGYTIKTAIRGNFKLFLKYGIKDVYVQYKIEEKVSDIEQFVIFTGTSRLSMGTKVSIVIKNLLMLKFMERDWIIGNNVDYMIKETIPGAIVADIDLLDQRGILIFGVPSLFFKAVVDYDAKSQYPSMMIAFNISKSTIHGRIVAIVDQDGKVISDGTEFNGLLQTIDTSILEIGTKYFGLPDAAALIKNFKKRLG